MLWGGSVNCIKWDKKLRRNVLYCNDPIQKAETPGMYPIWQCYDPSLDAATLYSYRKMLGYNQLEWAVRTGIKFGDVMKYEGRGCKGAPVVIRNCYVDNFQAYLDKREVEFKRAWEKHPWLEDTFYMQVDTVLARYGLKREDFNTFDPLKPFKPGSPTPNMLVLPAVYDLGIKETLDVCMWGSQNGVPVKFVFRRDYE
jgi:hypothetical protein